MFPMSSALPWIIFFLFVKHCTFCAAQYEGDECKVDNTTGVCTRLENCHPIRKELIQGVRPQSTCGYDQFHPIICCPKDSTNVTIKPGPEKPIQNPKDASQEKPATDSTDALMKKTSVEMEASSNKSMKNTTNASLATSLLRQPVGSKAKAKCEEFSKYVPYDNWTFFGESGSDPICKSLSTDSVVGGQPANRLEFPYMAAVGYGDLKNGPLRWQCGGSLISEAFVITAAHCTFNLNWGVATWVRLGVTKLENATEAKAQDIRIKEMIKHPEYKRPSEYHDIAILKLEKRATITDYVRPTCLPYTLSSSTEQKARATGWGQIEWGGDRSNYLLKVLVSIKEPRECNATFLGGMKDDRLERGIVSDWQICAGDTGKDTCQGDSGGPLVFENDDFVCMDTLIGVTSLGKFCGGISPGIYTRVYNYVPWIESIVWPDQ